ncbi:MAG: hypothetical protein AABX98_05995, partial [Nanoarchaeota archaeon]
FVRLVLFHFLQDCTTTIAVGSVLFSLCGPCHYELGQVQQLRQLNKNIEALSVIIDKTSLELHK